MPLAVKEVVCKRAECGNGGGQRLRTVDVDMFQRSEQIAITQACFAATAIWHLLDLLYEP